VSKRTIQILNWLRECDGKLKGELFNRGYVLGFLNGVKYDLDPWERQYLDVITDRVMRGFPS
jgi:hypothetical protein